MLHLSEGLLLSLSIGCSISMRHVLLFHVSMTVESRVANTCVCTVHSHLVYVVELKFVCPTHSEAKQTTTSEFGAGTVY